jgi:hypothetical protein
METSEKRGEKEMTAIPFLTFLIGGMIGFSTCAIFSVRAYEKGYKDGSRYEQT